VLISFNKNDCIRFTCSGTAFSTLLIMLILLIYQFFYDLNFLKKITLLNYVYEVTRTLHYASLIAIFLSVSISLQDKYFSSSDTIFPLDCYYYLCLCN
jgi:hypothetical protein